MKANMVKSFLDVKESSNLSPLTLKSYSETLRFFSEVVGSVNSPSAKDAYAFLTHMKDRGNKPKSIIQRLSVLREYYKFMEIKFPEIRIKVNKKEVKFLTDADIEMLHSKMAEKDRLIFDILHETGLRVAEYLTLTKSSFDNQQITITGKGRKDRRIILPQELRSRVIKFCEDNANGEKQLFGTSKPTIQRRFARYSQWIGKQLHPHLCRHYFASKLLKNGASIVLVRDLLGHESIATTNSYVHQGYNANEVERFVTGKEVAIGA